MILRLENLSQDESDTTDNEVRVSISIAYVAEGPGLPEGYSLSPPYPNPFNSSVVLRFRIPRPSHVHLEVLDSEGRSVRTVARGVFPAGEHGFIWDGRDEGGRKVASGVYLCRLKVGGEGSLVRRMALVR